jgi:hypothetical protein
MKAGTDLVVDRSPLLLGEGWHQPLDGLNELERHRTLVNVWRWNTGQAGSALMGDQPVLGLWIVTDVGLSEARQDGETNPG